MKTQNIEFDFKTHLNLMLDGIEVCDADVNVTVEAQIQVYDDRDTGGFKKEVFVHKLKLEYTAEIPEDFCFETFGHNKNVFDVDRKQILNHPDIEELIQDYANENL